MENTIISPPKNTWILNPYAYRRRPTRVVKVGSVAVGGTQPIRVQSMTTTDTMNTDATVKQVLKLAEVGCEIARITAPTVLDAQNLEKIKSALLNAGCSIPLVADIHFRPDAAMVAADFVEKVRINPGNFVDGKAFKVREYTDDEYQSEIHRIEDKFTPLVLKLKKLKRAVRIGTNHGSLSDRIMNRYGDTPEGMVESALEYVRICQKNDFHDIILSMKASNPRIMVAAYRLLSKRMDEEGMDYPFHLGVTEAGDGPDGRIKSAAGIGSLLEDGIGDTIRVSLTEDPEYEVPVAFELARRYEPSKTFSFWRTESESKPEPIETSSRRLSEPMMFGPIPMGGSSPIRIISRINLDQVGSADVLAMMENRLKRDTPPEILEIPYTGVGFESKYKPFREGLAQETSRLAYWVAFTSGSLNGSQGITADGFVYQCDDFIRENEIAQLVELCRNQSARLVFQSNSISLLVSLIERLKNGRVQMAVGLTGEAATSVHGVRYLARQLSTINEHLPIILHWDSNEPQLDTAVVLGSLICDGVGDAIRVSTGVLSDAQLDFSYNLLQACGNRLTKTEFVSCPSCGRTLFDLQSTTERIKSQTGHLKGVKIAIMGCIVNGPGEMADADFGYVGGGPGKINLYVGKTCVQKSIPSDEADQKLIELIKSHGKWVDPPR